VFEWSIFERGTVDVACDPVVVKDGGGEFIVVHVVGSACDACVVLATLPDELEEVIYAGKDVVHENDGVKVLVLCVAELMERDKGCVADLCEVLYAVVERTTLTHRCADDDTETDAASESVEYAKEGLCLVR